MKRLLLSLLVIFCFTSLNAQVFWTEDFGTGCNQNQNANGVVTGNGTWTVVNTGVNVALANEFFISATEAGMGANNCGDGCLGNAALTSRTLHVGSVPGSPAAGIFCPTGDCGAAYDATVESNKRAESPIINCSGQTTITLDFEYIHFGEAGLDQASVWYYDGATWTVIQNPLPQTACCGGPCDGLLPVQGRWTAFSIPLPASANNNTNVQIGFQWSNDNNSSGADPSFAVDNITLSVPVTGSVAASFSSTDSTICENDCIDFNDLSTGAPNQWNWYFPGSSTATSNAQNPTNICYPMAGTYDVSLFVSDGTNTDSLYMANFITVGALPNTGSNGTAVLCTGASAVDLLDSLGGSPDAGGTWSGPSALANGDQGTFDPSSNAAGTYTYTVTNSCGTSNNDVVVTITPAPVAGTFGSTTLCPTDPATDLFNQLGGSPGTGGTWSGPSALANGDQGTFDPATNSAGTYLYTVTNSCGTDTASVTVTISPNPIPGTNGTASLCSNASSINLLDSLGGTPSSGGTWSGPSGLTGGDLGTFDPATNTAGTYTYTVNDCSGSPQTADVMVTITPAPVAGTFGSTTLCPTDPATDLFNQLGGSPGTGGTWSGPSALANGDQGTFDPATNAAGTYLYTVTNSCGTDTASVTVTITPNPIPGTNGTASLCSNASSINLLDSLGGTPSSGGTWSGPSGLTGGDLGTFDPATNTAGTYTYTVNDCSGSPQTADVVVTITPAPVAGTFGSTTLCPTDPATDLFNQLGGSPGTGGTWSGPSALANGDQGTFDPATNAAGTYLYTVTNSCGTDTASVTVTITPNPIPGTNGTASLCSNASSINLLDSLGGTPSSGGTWSGPSGLTGGDLGTFDPATNTAGTYTYTVNDCSGSPQTADVVVTITPAPNAGTNGNITLCNTDPSTDLFNQLGGSPDNGGTWSPALTSGTGVFDPAVDAGGTYTYTVTNSCGSISADVTVTVTPCTTPTANYTVSDSIVCAGECITFTDASSGATSWQWTFTGGSPSSATGAGPHNVCYGTDGTYNVELIVTNSNGSDTATSTVVVNATPVIDAGFDVTINLGDSTELNAIGTNGTYSWTPPTWLDCGVPCIGSTQTSTPEETITYTVIVTDSNGCTASDDVTVIVDFDYVIWVPNIFSPNGDGANDEVFVRGAGVASLQFFIYDRWGEKVFETTDMDTGWDGTFRGKKMNNAVFVYYLEATFLDGTEVTKKGDITLVR